MKKLALIGSLTIIMSFFMGCSVNRKTISFKESNAYFLKENISKIDINSLTQYIDEGDNIVIVSTETEDTYDSNINSTIEDVLIKKFLDNGISVLERDNDLVYRVISESDNNYTHYLKNKKVSQGTSSSLGVSDSFFSNLKFSSAASSNSMYASGATLQEKENFDQMTINTNLLTADKIFAYRVIEHGIIYEKENATTSSNQNLNRKANTILSFRIEDAKTGKILSMVDIDQSSSDQIPKSDKDLLEKYQYRNYPFSYPNIYGNPNQVEHKSQNSNTGLIILSTLGVIAAVSISLTM